MKSNCDGTRGINVQICIPPNTTCLSTTEVKKNKSLKDYKHSSVIAVAIKFIIIIAS